MNAHRKQRGRHEISRRDWLRLASAGVLGTAGTSGWFRAFAEQAAADPDRRRSCILLWMAGGPSQTDTFDLKPDHENGGPFKAIETSVSGIRISEHLPKIAQQMQHMAIVRSMSTKEGDHARATYLLRTGHLPQGPILYPTLGSLVSKELRRETDNLPSFVSIAPNRVLNPTAYGPGFLGPSFAPLVVGGPGTGGGGGDEEAYERSLRVKNLEVARGIELEQSQNRLMLLKNLENDFLGTHPDAATRGHITAYEKAVRMMRSDAAGAFQFDEEPAELRDAYGRNQFGHGCLLARRLVERGVPFVEVSLNGVDGNATLGWDTHQDNFEGVKALSNVLDPAWSTLVEDLRTRGLLDTTLIVWMGEFGRTPTINPNQGRDHFPNAWSTVLCGGGIRGGQVVGQTSDDGTEVADRPVAVPDLLATMCEAVGIDYLKQNMSNVGRPIRLVDAEADPLYDILS